MVAVAENSLAKVDLQVMVVAVAKKLLVKLDGVEVAQKSLQK